MMVKLLPYITPNKLEIHGCVCSTRTSVEQLIRHLKKEADLLWPKEAGEKK